MLQMLSWTFPNSDPRSKSAFQLESRHEQSEFVFDAGEGGRGQFVAANMVGIARELVHHRGMGRNLMRKTKEQIPKNTGNWEFRKQLQIHSVGCRQSRHRRSVEEARR